jgi:hypothetical protein
LNSSIDIDAGPERVWQVLTDFAAYREWNPFIVSVDGSAEVGARLTVRMQPVGARAVTLPFHRAGGGPRASLVLARPARAEDAATPRRG